MRGSDSSLRRSPSDSCHECRSSTPERDSCCLSGPQRCCCSSPMTPGTSTGGPVDMTRFTEDPAGSIVPGAGIVVITLFSATEEDRRMLELRTGRGTSD